MLSKPSFDIGPKKSWDARTDAYASIPCRKAQVYVFALHAHSDRATVDPLDVTQWKFFVVPTTVLDCRVGHQKRIGLSGLQQLGATAVPFAGIAGAVADSVRAIGPPV